MSAAADPNNLFYFSCNLVDIETERPFFILELINCHSLGNAMTTPAIIYELGGKFDNSWNQGLFDSASAWSESSGSNFRELELQSDAQRLQALKRFAQAGNNPVFLASVHNLDTNAASELFSEFPETDFVTFAMSLTGGASGALAIAANAYIIVFDGLELARVAGYAAALTSKTGKIGIIGTVEDAFSAFVPAFTEGARNARPDISILVDFVGSTASIWEDFELAAQLASEQAAAGADTFFSQAGASTYGVYDFALKADLMTIGYGETIQDEEQSSHVFTIGPDFSDAVSDVIDTDTLSPGENLLGFSEGYLQIGAKGYDSDVFTAEIRTQVATFIDALDDTVPPVTVVDEFLEGSDESDVLIGGEGDDTIIGGAGSDEINGGSGADLLIGGDVADVSSATGARIFRVYQATLDRAPDSTGYGNWSDRLDSGERTLLEVIEGFVNSAEFQATYGALDNTAFVSLLYQNVLRRAPDATGLGNWVGRLEDGMSRAEVVHGFSESGEFKDSTNAAASAYAAAETNIADKLDDVFRLYQATLDRAPDLTGLENWATRLEDGTAYVTVANGFVASPEFQSTYGALDNEAFVTQLYQNVLGRAPDATGLSNWTQRLEDGMSRAAVVQGFAQAPEFVANTEDAFMTFMRSVEGDTFDGGEGDDLQLGSFRADHFIFDAADSGRDRVLQIDPWDTIELTGFGYQSRSEALAQFSEVGRDTVFADGAVSVVFANSTLESFDDVTLLL